MLTYFISIMKLIAFSFPSIYSALPKIIYIYTPHPTIEKLYS